MTSRLSGDRNNGNSHNSRGKTLKQESTNRIWRIVPLFPNDMSVYTESTNESSEKLLELIRLQQRGWLQNICEKNQNFETILEVSSY